MSDYLIFRAGLRGKSERLEKNEAYSVREGEVKRIQESKEKKEEAIKQFERDFNVKEMP